ncbi:hypothetical protein QTP70_015614, partial [Hemibagrus guttatus]
YPLSKDKARGIDKILSALLDQGVVVPVHSSYNTPVNPVPKPNEHAWRARKSAEEELKHAGGEHRWWGPETSLSPHR